MNVLFISLCIYFLHFAIVAYRTHTYTHAQRTSSRRLWLDWKVFLKTLFELLNSSYRFAFQSGFVSRQLNEIDFYSAISQFNFTCGIFFSQVFEVSFPALSKIFNNLRSFLCKSFCSFSHVYSKIVKSTCSRSRLRHFHVFPHNFPQRFSHANAFLVLAKKRNAINGPWKCTSGALSTRL